MTPTEGTKNGPWFDEEVFAVLRETVKPEIFQRLLKLFLENTGSKLAEVMALDPAAEPERLAVALHALKGSALMVGAHELVNMAEELRAAARRRDVAAMDEGRRQLETALQRVHERIKEALEPSTSD